jgi:undecaprenyl-diphosphatase
VSAVEPSAPGEPVEDVEADEVGDAVESVDVVEIVDVPAPSAATEQIDTVEEVVAEKLHPFGPYVARFDAAAERWLDRWRGHPVPDTMFRTASRLGEWSLIWHGASAAIAVAQPRRAGRTLRLAILLGAESLIVNQGIKRLITRTRPLVAGDPRHRLRRPRTSSFPSGHASSGFFAATLLSRVVPQLRPVWYAAATVVAVSRPYVRIHHASDVVAGAVVGRVLARIAGRVWPE